MKLSRMTHFAYASNMDENQMMARCGAENAMFVACARLPKHRFIINTRGVATIIWAPDKEVYGVLWEISAECEESLDQCEGVRWSTYRKQTVSVCMLTPGQEFVEAMTYVASNQELGSPRPGYMERVVDAAVKHGFQTTYINELRSWTEKQCLGGNMP